MPLAPAHVELGEDDAALVQAARDFAQNELLPLDRKWDEDESSLTDILPVLGEMGFLNLVIPEELNGLGCSHATYGAILHEIAAFSPSTAVTISVHSMVGAIVDECGSDAVRAECLSDWGSADAFAAFALSEAGAGSDAKAVKVTAPHCLLTNRDVAVSAGIINRASEPLCSILVETDTHVGLEYGGYVLPLVFVNLQRRNTFVDTVVNSPIVTFPENRPVPSAVIGA